MSQRPGRPGPGRREVPGPGYRPLDTVPAVDLPAVERSRTRVPAVDLPAGRWTRSRPSRGPGRREVPAVDLPDPGPAVDLSRCRQRTVPFLDCWLPATGRDLSTVPATDPYSDPVSFLTAVQRPDGSTDPERVREARNDVPAGIRRLSYTCTGIGPVSDGSGFDGFIPFPWFTVRTTDRTLDVPSRERPVSTSPGRPAGRSRFWTVGCRQPDPAGRSRYGPGPDRVRKCD